MRSIFPRRSFSLEADFWESHGERPGCSSSGANPSDEKGLLLSPAEIYKSPLVCMNSDPAEWQHSWRWVAMRSKIFSEDRSSVSPTIVNREMCCSEFVPAGE